MGESSKDKDSSAATDGAKADADGSGLLDLTDEVVKDRELESVDGAPLVRSSGTGAGRRLAGMLAAALGLIGCILSFAFMAVSIRLVFVADDIARDTAEPLVAAVDRLDTRIDQADDLIDRDGVDGSDFLQLQARIDGLADTAGAAGQSFAAIDDHALYRWLPIDKTDLASSLSALAEGSTESAGVVDGVQSLSAAQAGRIGDRVNTMQTSVSSVGDKIDATVDSLIRWLRLSSLGGFLLSLWSLWAQVSLMKRGWRGVRGQQP